VRALRLVEWQRPAALVDVPEPEPGPGEVLIRVGGAGACHSDLHLLDWPPGVLPFEVPFTLGHENAGWVEAVGAGVHGLELGTPVAVYGPWGCGMCHSCREGAEDYCERPAPAMGGGLGRDGGMAELLVVPSPRLLVPLGDLDPVRAAPLTDAALTPYHAIARSRHKLVPGAHAVVIGAGGLGHMAVQILRELTPARIVVVDRNPATLAMATSLGAAATIEAGPDAAAEVRDATGGRGAELVVDLVGSDDTLSLAMAVGRPRGDVVLVGIAGGSHTYSFFSQPYELSLASTYWGTITELMEVIALAQQGRIAAEVEVIPLSKGAEVYERMRAGTITGRVVVDPTS
jgi:alcohol dehydrogenase, propanol-preferring